MRDFFLEKAFHEGTNTFSTNLNPVNLKISPVGISVWEASEQPGKEFCLGALGVGENYVW